MERKKKPTAEKKSASKKRPAVLLRFPAELAQEMRESEDWETQRGLSLLNKDGRTAIRAALDRAQRIGTKEALEAVYRAADALRFLGAELDRAILGGSVEPDGEDGEE